MSRISSPPRAHEMMAAGPASTEALRAPNSQPEPMIEPTLANSRPITPTWRFSFVSDAGRAWVDVMAHLREWLSCTTGMHVPDAPDRKPRQSVRVDRRGAGSLLEDRGHA